MMNDKETKTTMPATQDPSLQATAAQTAPQDAHTSAKHDAFTDELSMHASTSKTITIDDINTAPAQTWNYLKVNNISFTLPAPVKSGALYARLPQMFERMGYGLGARARAWIEACAPDSHFIEVPKGEARTQPIVLDVNADNNEIKDTGVILREGSEACVVLVSHGTSDTETTSANVCRIVVERDASLHLVEIVAMGDTHQHLEGVGLDLADRANVDVHQYALGGKKVAFGFDANLAGNSSRVDLLLRYLVRGREMLDVSHIASQRGRNTRCTMLSNGILYDYAHKTLREVIDLIHGSKGSKGNEAETVLVASDNVVNQTLPVILCDEDDVMGNHGASIGSIGPEQLGYLSDRGLTEEEANKLFERAIFDDAAIHAPDAVSRDAVLAYARTIVGDEVADDFHDALGDDRAYSYEVHGAIED